MPTLTIERDSPLPLYHQLKTLLATKIRGGEWHPGDLIPGEQELQTTYSLSRTTVRQALRELELDGVLTRYRGKGTFVAKPKLTHDPEGRRGLTQTLLGQGMTPGWRVHSAGTVVASSDVALRLSIASGTQVYQLRRIRLANDEPIGHHVAHVAPAFAHAVDAAALTQGRSLSYLGQQAPLEGATAERLIEAVAATEQDAEILDCPVGSPMLRITRLLATRTGVPVEDCRSIYRGDRFQYHLCSGASARDERQLEA